MDKHLISTGTRHAFREYLVRDSALNQIQGLFGGAGVLFFDLPAEKLPTGQRRALIEQYYASVDWSSLRDVTRILRVFEAVLLPLSKVSEPFSGLVKFLAADGFSYENGQLVRTQAFDLHMIINATGAIDRPAIRDHLRRIEQNVESDPSLAIGSAKELVETIAKLVISRDGRDPEQFDSVPRLVKEAMRSLDLSSENLSRTGKWADSARQILAGLAQVVGGIAELRNIFGTGHGRLDAAGVEPRHARLVVGAASTIVTFFLDTMERDVP